jgi:hypothetical protein
MNHAGNPVARWMADSLEAKTPRDDPDRVRPVKPDRAKSGKRIDGMVSSPPRHRVRHRSVVEEAAALPPRHSP